MEEIKRWPVTPFTLAMTASFSWHCQWLSWWDCNKLDLLNLYLHFILRQVNFGKNVSSGNISQRFFHSPLSCLIIVWLGQFLYLSHTSAHLAVLYTWDYSVRSLTLKEKWDLVSLYIKLTGQGIHKLRLRPGKEGQPVLIPHSSIQHKLFCERGLGLGAGLFDVHI